MNNIQIHTEDNTVATLYENQDIHNAILKKTKEIFEEINDLPISDPKLTEYIGEYAQNVGEKDILQKNTY